MGTNKVLGVDIGGTKIAICLADDAGNVIASDRIPSGVQTPYEQVLPRLAETARKLVADQGLAMGDIRCCGIAAPGPLDMQNGVMSRSPNMVWADVPIRDDLARELGIKTSLDNDANGGVLAEYFFGGHRGCKDLIYVTMSTGVGFGVISGGNLVTGKSGIAGEMGHMVLDVNGPKCPCGLAGCMEVYCGGRSVADRLQAMLKDKQNHPMYRVPGVDGKPEKLNFQAVREGAKLGIPLAIQMWDEICMRLAQGLGIAIITFNPEVIVLGTAAYYAGDFLLEPVRRYLPRFTWQEMLKDCSVEVSALGLKVGELAGASIALNGLRG